MIRPIPYLFFFLFGISFFISPLLGQKIERNCSENAQFYDKAAQEQLEVFTKKYIKNYQNGTSSRGKITIPTVIHIVYPTEKENISDEQVSSQIEALNRDFNALNNNLDRIHPDFQDRIGKVGFNFCLATVDPEGNPTNGITRTATDEDNVFIKEEGNIFHTERGGQDPWDTQHYLNIWVTRLAPNIGGFASKPGENRPEEDGVVISIDFFGQLGTALPNYRLGRTGTHEVGHYFNLFHPFNNSCNGDDFVADVPQQLNGYQGDCSGGENTSCGNRDNVSNFMNNSQDICLAMFTKGQAMRMQAALIGARSGLLNNKSCQQSNPPNFADGIKIYPNPASYYFCIEVGDFNLEQIPYTIFNTLGAKVEEGVVQSNSLKHFPTFRNGIYFIQFMDGSKEGIVKKVMINY